MIEAITRNEILNGISGHEDYHCCMFGVDRRNYQCDMWPTVFDEVGGIGYLARNEEEIVGQLIFMPKMYARRIAISTSADNTNIERTIVISCLYVAQDHGGRGIGSKMIAETMDFCRDHDFSRVEAIVDHRPPSESGINTSYHPFRKFDFILDDSREGWEDRPDSQITYLELGTRGEQHAGSNSEGLSAERLLGVTDE